MSRIRMRANPLHRLQRVLVMSRKTAVPETAYRTLETLLADVRDCRACDAHLPLGPRPVLRAGETARILVVGQAPGARVHATGIAWGDPSGERLRTWMGMDENVFYDESRIAIIPMGFAIQAAETAAICRRAMSARRCGSIICWPSCRGLS